MKHYKLAAVKVERREVAAAVFEGTHLDYVQLRQLSSVHEKADSSALGFVHWIVITFDTESVALEEVDAKYETRRKVLAGLIGDSLRQSSIFVWKVRKRELFPAYGMPPVKSRREIREVVRSVWPILDEGKRNLAILDAVALGLYVQTERLFAY